MEFRCYDWGFANLGRELGKPNTPFYCPKPDSSPQVNVLIDNIEELAALARDYDIMIKERDGKVILTFDSQGGNFRQR